MRGVSSERWSRISACLDEALELLPAARPAWLATLAAREPEVAAEVQELLQRHEVNDAAQFLEHSPLATDYEPEAGEQVGAYTLERPLGRGGMGSVWLAKRSDGRFEGSVAIKLLTYHTLGADAGAQIRREASLLAQVSHPNIARLFDAGVSARGQPYLILEYVEGARIDEYCNAGALASQDRLRLLQVATDAVAHAHQHHIVHRDLKPSNILVTREGVVKLLDFGVASLHAVHASQESAPLGPAPAGMTPGYAAPEQIRGESVTAATDVYALGVLTHVLLTNRHPLGGADSSSTKLIRATLTADERLAPDALALPGVPRWLRRDLESMVSKATCPTATQRYQSAGELSAELRRLLAGQPVLARAQTLGPRLLARLARLAGRTAESPYSRTRLAGAGVVLAALCLLGALAWRNSQVGPAGAPASTFAPPARSVAVLPFVNMSGDKGQEYFSDGLTEELLNSLSQVTELQVAARTSSFSFKGTNTDIGTIARKLNVAAVLEGSVRRSGSTVRITTQLINAVTGYHFWSHTYDRNLGDVLQLQTDIATAVAAALKVSLLGSTATRIELGGTRNPDALDAYLRGRKLAGEARGSKDGPPQVAAFTEAIRLDPNYALAYANRSFVLSDLASNSEAPANHERFDQAQADARRAIALSPDLAEGHLALAFYFELALLDFARADAEYQHALALAPGDAWVQRLYASFAAILGHTEAALAAARRAVVLDPLNRDSHRYLGDALYYAHQYREAIAAYQRALALDPEWPVPWAYSGLAYYKLGDFEHARVACERKPEHWPSVHCLALTYDRLGRHADAESQLAILKARSGDDSAYQYAQIYAQWGQKARALEWLGTAMRLRDPGLELLKTDPLMDPLRTEPSFQAALREARFPD